MVSGAEVGAEANVCFADPDGIRENEVRLVDPSAGTPAAAFVGCGWARPPHEIVVVDPVAQSGCNEDQIGEIWFSGPSVAAGYWKNPDATATTFNAVLPGSDRRYLRTGDYGFIHGCELFITGRLKDCIVIRGRNHYPQDIEWTAEGTHDAVRTGGCVAFSIDHQDDEKLIIVAEINRKSRSELAGVIEAIREAVTREHEIQAFAVVLIQAGALPKTSSG